MLSFVRHPSSAICHLSMPTIASLYRYPVKGLSPEALTRVSLAPFETFPNDRAYAIENGRSKFDPAAPRWLPKASFLMLMKNKRMAALTTRFDDQTATLTIRHGGAVVAEGRLDTDAGRRAIEAFFQTYTGEDLRGPPKILSATGHSFSDVASKVVSLINLASLRDLAGHAGTVVHPLRFRGNLYVEGLPAWTETGWIGREIGAGSMRLKALQPIPRCAATNVNPETAIRDLTVPETLSIAYGTPDCGIYLEVVEAGEMKVGDAISPI
jgi:uncharacterized protein YcbX